ncbi:hypothetical protein EVAR_34059_1 [Eumeta japonica]|uniref:Uncharacterized protein n=1 Tax=Eumeta variegata TaxID=151549 RepID=A0A4C1VR70_EUMVA|nr:hypothetical protein EVAR_34059_1 [Eumeta japonica]
MTSETSQLPNPTVETSQDNQGILVSSPLPSSSSGQNLMTDYIRNTKPLPHQKAKELDEQLIKLIAKEYHPFRIVEGAVFKKFIYLLNPRYSPPTRKTLANVLLPQLYAKVQNEVEQLVAATLAISHYRRVDIDNQRKFYCNNCSLYRYKH